MNEETKKTLASLNALLKKAEDAAEDEAGKKAVRAEFLAAVKDESTDLYNAIHAAGFKGGGAKTEEKLAKALERNKTLEATIKEHEEKIEQLEADKPDIAAAVGKVQKQLDKANAQIEKDKIERAAEKRAGTLKEVKDGVYADLIAAKVEPTYARGLVLQMVEDGNIIQLEDGTVEIRQLKDKDSTYGTTKGAKAWEGLIKDAVKAAPPNAVLSTVVPGAGGARGAPTQPRAETRPGELDMEDPVVKDKLSRIAYGRL